ncbi:MAG: hypothetical protein AB3N15_04600, partial [Paracoccaceae bacterium]
MNTKTCMVSLALACTAMTAVANAASAAGERCTVNTARKSVSTATLCSCGVVQDRMLRYLHRRSDFEDILARTSRECPAFAAVLTDYPTATVRSGLFSRGEDREGSVDQVASAANSNSSSSDSGNVGGSDTGGSNNGGGNDGGGGNSGGGNSGGGNSGGGNSGGG